MKTELVRNPDVTAASKITTAGRRVYLYRKGDKKLTDLGWVESAEFSDESDTKAFNGNRDGIEKKVKEVLKGITRSLTVQTASTGDFAVKEMYLGTRLIAGQGLDTTDFTPSAPVTAGTYILADGFVYEVTKAGTTGAEAPAYDKTVGSLTTTGDAALRNVGTVDANRIYGAADTLGNTEVAVIFVQSTLESDGLNGATIVRVFPNAMVRGNGTPTIQDFDGYELEISMGANQGFTPPAELVDFGTVKLDGFLYVVPNSQLPNTEDALGQAVIAYVDTPAA